MRTSTPTPHKSTRGAPARSRTWHWLLFLQAAWQPAAVVTLAWMAMEEASMGMKDQGSKLSAEEASLGNSPKHSRGSVAP